MSTKINSILFSCFLCLCLLSDFSAAGGRAEGRYEKSRFGEEHTAIVLPARYTIVKLGFDMAQIRSVTLVSYEGDATSKAPALYVWNNGIGEWVSTSVEAFSSAAAFDREPSRVILLGGEADLPGVLVKGSSWSAEVVRIPTHSIVDLVNGFDDAFDFSLREWRWLAKRYKLTLIDLNANKRRYGRYGRPGSKRKRRKSRGGDLSKFEDEVPMPASDDDLPVPTVDYDVDEVKGMSGGEDADSIPELDKLGLDKEDQEEIKGLEPEPDPEPEPEPEPAPEDK